MREISEVYIGEQDQQRNRWSDLPCDLLGSLLCYLPPNSRCAVKATCKSWRVAETIFPPPINSWMSPRYYSGLSLMFTHLSMSRYKFYNPINHEYFHVNATASLKGAIVRCSSFGWLLMSCPNLDMFFYNPITKQTIKLPRIDVVFTAMCFTSPPTSSDCRVFAISDRIEYNNTMGIIRRGEESWTLCNHGVLHEFYFSTHNPIFYRGSFYCLDKNGNIGVFTPDGETGEFIIHYTSFKKKGIRQSFLLEDDGKLLGVFNRRDKHMNVVYLDLESWKWQPVLCLQNKSLFVSHSNSFAIATKNIGNRVYLPKFHDGVGVFYCLDTMKYYSVVGNFSSTTSYELEEILEFGVWIQPNFDVEPLPQLNWSKPSFN